MMPAASAMRRAEHPWTAIMAHATASPSSLLKRGVIRSSSHDTMNEHPRRCRAQCLIPTKSDITQPCWGIAATIESAVGECICDATRNATPSWRDRQPAQNAQRCTLFKSPKSLVTPHALYRTGACEFWAERVPALSASILKLSAECKFLGLEHNPSP
jgi:hypothetical protein